MPRQRERHRTSKPARSIVDVHEGLGKVVVVAEQRAGIRHVVRDTLERRGYTVLETTDEVQALRLTSHLESQPDIVVVDHDLLEPEARDLVETLSREGRLPPILVIPAETMRRSPSTAVSQIGSELRP